MAYIDLKNCIVRFRDGHNKIGAVNNSSGYPTGTTTIVVDGFTGAVAKTAIFKIGSGTQEYNVVSTVETLNNTTSITFSPALTAAVVDNAVITVGGRATTVKIGDGNITYTAKRMTEDKKDRGLLDEVRLGDQERMDISLQMAWTNLVSVVSEPATPYESLYQEGPASVWETTSIDPCSPFSIDIEVVRKDPCGVNATELYLFKYFHHEQVQGDVKAGNLQVSGKCNSMKPIISRY